MAYEQKDNSGSLFANDRREKESHPHAKGTALIDGREYWVDAWTNTSAGGKKYQSLKFKLKEEARPGAADERHRANLGKGGFAPAPDDLDDDIPF